MCSNGNGVTIQNDYAPQVRGLADKELLISLSIFALALCLRLAYLYEISDIPSFEHPIVDSEKYSNMARALAAGKGMSQELFWFWQPFFYPFFLSVVYRFGNSSILCAKVIQALLGSFTCLLTYWLGKKVFNPAAGLIAALIVVFYGPLIFFESELLASGWASFWSLVLVLLFLETSSKKKLWSCLLLGICGALAIVTRPTFLPFFAAGVVWLVIVFYRNVRNWRQVGKRTGAILTGLLLIAIPIAALNCRVTGHFGILPASGGINFYIGNNPDYAETIGARPGSGWEEITTLPAKNGVLGDIWEEQKFYNREVAEYISKEPSSFVKGLVHKSIHFLSARELPRNVDVYLFTKWSKLLDLLVWKVGQFGFPFGVLLPLAVLGLISCWKKLPWPLLLFVILYPLSIILVFVSARYRVVVIPSMAVMASAGLLNIIEAMRGPHWRRMLIFSLITVLVVLLSTLPGPFPQERANYEAEFYRNVAAAELNRGKTEQALAHADRALQLMPEFGSVHATMGDVLTEMGRTDEAIEYFKHAIRLAPNLTHPHLSLGIAMANQNKLDQAVNHFTEVLRIDPRTRKALLYLGMIYSGQGDFKESLECFTKLLKLEPNSALAHNNLGQVLAQQDKLGEAIEHFNKALQIKPDFAEAQQNLEDALKLLAEQASPDKDSLQMLSDDPAHLNNLGSKLIQKGDFAQAARYFTKSLQIDPNSAEAHRKLGYALVQQGELDKAIEHLREALRINPDFATAYNDLGVALLMQGKFDEAIVHFEQSIKIMPDLADARENLKRALQIKKELEQRTSQP